MPDDTDPVWLLERMAEFERSIGALYSAFAEKFPDRREFWESFSAEEEQHAAWLESFPDLKEAGVARISGLRFSMREIDEGLAFVRTELGKAMQREFTNDRALDVALLVEASILEKDYYRAVGDPTDAVRELLESLAEGARDHLRRLEAARRG